ncbi:uncharacterized protein EAF02_002404 [Botrytis sinoallii]|uniref:uncharacterized protein n=1 Tax=Botrytis sinoallii TaxID=1463999 RepID=UPI00190293D0|nr:uncharacterized protein EAF02_002404 [Botrytis sinoallii]KAF7889989.1 hypothetical protein EAF02_002404 [Botrytis sinoallii]
MYQLHNRFIATVSNREGTCGFAKFPLYHSWGNKHITNTMWIRKTIRAKIKSSVLYDVPYALKLGTWRQSKGVEEMASCSEVLYSGSQCLDSLGDCLTSDQFLFIAENESKTEFGSFGSSRGRTPGDHSWNYLRIMPSDRPHCLSIIFVTTVTANSDDPSGSYHFKDIFTPHPLILNAWKYLGRIDN